MFINTVTGNKEIYSNQQIKAAEQARRLYAYLGYPSVKYYNWAIQGNKIKDFPGTVQEIDVAYKIWVNSVPYLKGNATRKKPNPVAGGLVETTGSHGDGHVV